MFLSNRSSQSDVEVTIGGVLCIPISYTPSGGSRTTIVCDTGNYGSSIQTKVHVSVGDHGIAVEVSTLLLTDDELFVCVDSCYDKDITTT